MFNKIDQRARNDYIEEVMGKPHLSDETKLGILQQKRLQMVTQQTIANEYNTSRKTVNQLTEDDLSEDGKEKLKTFIEQLGEIRTKTAKLILKKLNNETIKDGVLPTLLNIANQNYRLETDQPTSITKQENLDPVALAFTNTLRILRENCDATGRPFPSESEIVQRINEVARVNQIDAEKLRERVLLPGNVE